MYNIGYREKIDAEEYTRGVIYDIASQFIYKLNQNFFDLNAQANRVGKGVPVKTFSLNKVGRGCMTYVSNCSYSNSLTITIDADMVEEYAITNQVSIETATRLLTSHEILHVLLGHFSEKYKDYDKNILNIAGDLEINSCLNMQHPGIIPEDYGFSRMLSTDIYYKKLLEMAKSKKGNATKSSSQSGNSATGNSSNMTSSENKTEGENGNSDENDGKNGNSDGNSDENDENNVPITYRNSEKNSSQNSNAENNSQNSQNSMGRGEYGDSELKEEEINNHSQEESVYDPDAFRKLIEDAYGINLPKDVSINTATSDRLGNDTIELSANGKKILGKQINDIKELTKKLTSTQKNEYKNFTIEGLEPILARLVRKEKEQSITPHGKVDTYFKINNRRKSDFILPGRKLTGGATRKKFSNGLTVFIDVSGSTGGSINHDLMGVAYRLKKQGATIIYYRSGITLEVKSSDPFISVPGSGCTNIVNTIKEYTETHKNKLERVYVFTDGQDDFRKMGDVCDKYSVFFVHYGKISEVFNNNHPQTSRW